MHVVLVHGAGGSPITWSSLLPMLEMRNLPYSVVDHPSQSLADDVAAVLTLLESRPEPALLVGHSYGGAIITNAGRHDKARGLVYVAAFAPDEGESVNGIVEQYEPAEVQQYMTRGPRGEWIVDDSEEARLAVAWDVPADVVSTGHRDIKIASDAIFKATTGQPAWAELPSWYIVATQDKHLRTQAQRDMAARAGATVVEASTSHAVPHANPLLVMRTIENAIAALA